MRSIYVYFTPPQECEELSPGMAGKFRIGGDNSRRSFTHCYDVFTRRKPMDSFEMAFLSQLKCFHKMVLAHGMDPAVAHEAMMHFPEYYSDRPTSFGHDDTERATAFRHRLSHAFHKSISNANAHAEGIKQ